MGMNSGLFDSPNGRHSERSYQITRKKRVRAVTQLHVYKCVGDTSY